MIDLNDVMVFTRVVEQGGFSAAARQLDLPKSSVSARVARLEDRLGVRLLERTTRKLRLTEVGQRYFEHARRVILELEEAAVTVESFSAEPRGLLRITAPPVLGQALLAPIIAEFTRQQPKVRVQVDLSNRRVDLIEEGFDVALRAGALPDSSLVARRLGRGAARLFASPSYLAARGTPKTPEELAGHDLLENGSVDSRGWQLQGDAGEGATVKASFRLISNDHQILIESACAGLGIASLPSFIAASAVVTGRLTPVLPAWAVRVVDLWAVYPSHKSLSPALRAFIELTAARLGERLPVG